MTYNRIQKREWDTFCILTIILIYLEFISNARARAMAVSRKIHGARKILFFMYIQVLCCGLFDINLKKTTRVTSWQELYVCLDHIKVKIFTNDFKRQRKFKQRPLANSVKLTLGLRLLLYALYSVFLIKLSGDVEINPGPQCNVSRNLQRKKPVKCASINVRSLTSVVKSTNGEISSNLQRFQNFVYAEDIDIVFANETWLSNSVDNAEILHSEYTLFRNDRKGRGGDVMLGIRTGLFKTIHKIEHNYDLEFILVRLTTLSNLKILLCSCYRPPSAEKIWMETFENFLNDICSRHLKIVLAGDFNLPRACWISGGNYYYYLLLFNVI